MQRRRGALFHRDPRRLEGELDGQPEHVEIDEMHDLAVEKAHPRPVDDEAEEQAGNQEEVGHPERSGKLDDIVQPAMIVHRLADAERRMHHHHEDDADTLGGIDPADAVGECCSVGGLHLRSLRTMRLCPEQYADKFADVLMRG